MGSPVVLPESSSSSPNFEWSYDVFLSFRGEDTRSNFTSHLDMALRQKGVNVFIDDKLNRGEQISESLFKSIEEALISIVIFSQNYASSSWCLDELVKIIECKKSKGRIVWPIFYKVDPSDVRKQTGSFGEALAKHQAKFMKRTQTWRDALTTAANLSGWDLGTRKEADLIQDVVKGVLSILNHTCMPLHVAKYPVGVDFQLKQLNFPSQQYLSDGVYMLGIYGIGGIGKTTLAKALFNKIANQFEGCCFLLNVRETSKQSNGLVQLQENLLYEILKDDSKIVNLDKGISIMSNRMRSKKVLIVLDDVDKREQLEALVGGCDWFGRGSTIIVTTRNKHLLSSQGFEKTHNIQGLDENKALELFSWHAFKECHPSSNYLDLSKRATTYCKGLPLALVVLGSFLCSREQSKWESILDEFENSQSKDIKDILQISFDGLEDREKDIFLDISCLFVGVQVNYIKKILSTCYFNLDFGIIVLTDLSLITIENGKVQMHDLIRQMGHKIVNGESSEPGKRSRLWLAKDIWEVFSNNSGTDAVKAIKLDLPNPTRLNVDPKAFRNMKNLRLLIIRNATFSKKLEYLPINLKWIVWRGFTQPSLPRCLITKNLVGLDLQHSSITNFGKGFKDCERLKHVNLSHSTLLEKIHDFSAASNLEELYLSNCTNLRTIHKSVVSLDKLIILHLDGCSTLKKIPRYSMLKSLAVLNLSYCKILEKIPDISSASNLKELQLLECTNLRTVHESIGTLNKLRTLNLKKCTSLEKLPSHLKLKSLFSLNLSCCYKLEKFPEIDQHMESLTGLDLDLTAIKELPSSIGYLTRLEHLNLNSCTNLISLPSTIYLLEHLRKFELGGCCRLDKFPYKWEPTNQQPCSSSKIMETSSTSEFPHLLVPKQSLYLYSFTVLDLQSCNISNTDFLEILCNVAPFLLELLLSENKFASLPSCLHKFMSLWNLQLKNCKFLREIPNLPQNIQKLDASGCKSLTRSDLDSIVDIISKKQQDFTLGDISREFLLTDCEIPDWFSYQTTSNLVSASYRHYPDMERTLAACVILKVNGDSYEKEALVSCNIFICNRLHCSFTKPFLPSTSEYMWLVTTSLAFSSMLEVKDWSNVLVCFEVGELLDEDIVVSIKRCGVHVTEELHGVQMDVKWPVVNYTDFYQHEKLPTLDIEASFVRRFVQAVSTKLNCKSLMHVFEDYDPDRIIDFKTQPMIFPLHVSFNGYTMLKGMVGMGETALAKSLYNKLERNGSSWENVLNNPTSFSAVYGRNLRSSFWSSWKDGDGERRINITTCELSSRKYLIIFVVNGDRGGISRLFYGQNWFQLYWNGSQEDICELTIGSVDISRCHCRC